MEITEVRVKLVPPGHDKLRAFCSITIDNDFVIRDLKVIEGSKGAFVAMPSRKLTNRCPGCGGKNHHRASYCNQCGRRLPPERVPCGAGGRAKLHADIAHPINSNCRNMIQRCVLDSYHEEQNRARDPSYRPRDLDDFERSYLDEELVGDVASDDAAGEDLEPMAPEVPGEEEVSPAADLDLEPGSGKRRVREVRPYGAGFSGRTDVRRGRWADEPAREEGERDALPSGGRFGSERLFEGQVRETARRKREGFADEDSEPEDNFGAGLFS